MNEPGTTVTRRGLLWRLLAGVAAVAVAGPAGARIRLSDRPKRRPSPPFEPDVFAADVFE